MLYRIKFNSRSQAPAQLESWDGIVIAATPSFWWAIGKDIGSVLWWAQQRYFDWSVSADGERSPSLGTPPTESEIAKRTSP